MSTAIHEPNASDAVMADPRIARADSPGLAREEATTPEPERSADLEIRLAIQTIASRILAAALIERAQEAESLAT